MSTTVTQPSRSSLADLGIRNVNQIFWNFGAARLIEEALRREEGHLAANGSLVVRTGQYTGRSPKDRFLVLDEATEKSVDWGDVNRPMSAQQFEQLHRKAAAHLQGRDVFVQECFAGADPAYAVSIRVVTQLAWHSLFARQLFVRPEMIAAENPSRGFTVICVPGLHADPEDDGVRSEAFIVLNFTRKLVLIGGTGYAGEMKKSVFALLNYLLPERGVFPMHCSANLGANEDVALFFGLSGTGKTTLSADPKRRLIGDDEHGWSDRGVFNFEGGCYAKCIRLSREKEPEIWNALRFGSVLENVVFDPETRSLDYNDASITENTRAAYPIDYIDNALIPSVAGHPKNIVFLAADAFGVLPPISRLTPEQAMYHFLSGYTAKVAGTERGLGRQPMATFSACFGAPFLPRDPAAYAEMLGARLKKHNARCWLVNTGWAGGAYGEGKRMDLPYTRAMLGAALSGELDEAEFVPHPVFGVAVPKHCPGVPSEALDPRGMWKDPKAYDRAAAELAGRFQENFAKFTSVPEEIRSAAPRV